MDILLVVLPNILKNIPNWGRWSEIMAVTALAYTTCMVAAWQKQCFIAMACDSKLQAILLWHVISMKSNIVKNIWRLEISRDAFLAAKICKKGVPQGI